MGTMQVGNMITANFSREEVKCKCCGIDLVSLTLMCKLQVVRDQYFAVFKEGLTLNCVCRCEKHNAEVGGEPDSAHLTTDKKVGEAADIACTDSHKRFVLLGLLLAQFNRIEVGDVWLHADTATDSRHPQQVIFLPKYAQRK